MIMYILICIYDCYLDNNYTTCTSHKNTTAACSKRGVVFILLLGFNLQSIVGVVSPYFNYWLDMPSSSWRLFIVDHTLIIHTPYHLRIMPYLTIIEMQASSFTLATSCYKGIGIGIELINTSVGSQQSSYRLLSSKVCTSDVS